MSVSATFRPSQRLPGCLQFVIYITSLSVAKLQKSEQRRQQMNETRVGAMVKLNSKGKFEAPGGNTVLVPHIHQKSQDQIQASTCRDLRIPIQSSGCYHAVAVPYRLYFQDRRQRIMLLGNIGTTYQSTRCHNAKDHSINFHSLLKSNEMLLNFIDRVLETVWLVFNVRRAGGPKSPCPFCTQNI